MSQSADIFIHFCEKIYRERMTLEERAELMVDLYENLDYDTYDLLDENGKYNGRNIELAISQLKNADENSK